MSNLFTASIFVLLGIHAIVISAVADTPGSHVLEGARRDGIVAFSKLLGYVRHFHASDQAAAADWDAVAVSGMRRIETASDPESLAATLEDLLGELAPTLRVVPTTAEAPADPWRSVLPESRKGIVVVSWHHNGFGQDDRIYTSKRIRERMEPGLFGRLFGGDENRRSADPTDRFVVALPGGVTAYLPLAVYANRLGTLPLVDRDPAPEPAPEPPYMATDRAVRLAAVALAWNVLQHFYPYFDVVAVDWDRVLVESLEEAATDDDAIEFHQTLSRMIAKLADGHGWVAIASAPPNGGLPLVLARVGSEIVVSHVENSGSGGAQDILARGDLLEQVNGRPVTEVLQDLATRISSSTPQFLSYAQLRVLERGRPVGEHVTLRFRSADDGTPKEVRLEYVHRDDRLDDPRPERMSQVGEGIHYVDISRVTDAEIKAKLDQILSAHAVIFDFRGYPRGMGFLDVISRMITDSVTSAQWHHPQVTRPDRADMTFLRDGEWLLEPKTPCMEGKCVFITDGRAISYAESCMGIVEHYRLGPIVGEATAGTNGNINPFDLPGGYTVTWTGMKVLKHDGSQHHGIGILPTHPVKRTIEGIRAGRDEMLEAAIALIEDSDD